MRLVGIIDELRYRAGLVNECLETAKTTNKKNPKWVVTVQGFVSNRGALVEQNKFLVDLGFNVISVDLGLFNIADVHHSAKKIADEVEARGIKKYSIVGHSMGGIIALVHALFYADQNKIENIVTLGSPIQGVLLATLGKFFFGKWFPCLHQLVPGNLLLKEVQDKLKAPRHFKLFTIRGKVDKIVPGTCATCEGAQDYEVDTGHLGLLVRKTVHELVASCLAT